MFKFFSKICPPILFFFLLTAILFAPYFRHGLVPIAGDILIGHYYPWKDQIWEGRTAGYPIKNFQIFDGIQQTLPLRILAVKEMKAGSWPLWNPYILLGMPLLGNFQAAALYPFNLLFWLLPEFDAWSIYIILQPFLAGIFGYFWGRSLKLSTKGSLAVGLFWGFSLIMMNRLENGIDGHTALWLPLALGAINKIRETGKIRWGLLLFFGIFMSLLAGYPPPIFYGLLLIFVFVIFNFWKELNLKETYPKLILVFLAVIFAFGLAAPQISPLASLMKVTVRDKVSFGATGSEAYFFPWKNLAMIIAPDFFGHPSTGNYRDRFLYTNPPSIGVIGFLLAVYSIGYLRLRQRNKEVIFWWSIFLFSMLCILETPLSRLIFGLNIPLFSSVAPMKTIWITVLSLSILAGFGLDKLAIVIKETGKKSLIKFFWPFLILWPIVFCLALWANLMDGEVGQVALRNLFVPGFCLLAATILVFVTKLRPRLSNYFLILLLAISAFELLREGKKYNAFIPKNLVYPSIQILSLVKNSSGLFRFSINHPELLPTDVNIFYGLSTPNGYVSTYDWRSGSLLKLANEKLPVTKIDSYSRNVFQTEHNSPILDLLGVKYIFSLSDLKENKFKLFSQIGKTRLYENKAALPRAFLAGDYVVAKDDLDIANNLIGSDLSKTVILEKEPPLKVNNGYQGGEVEIVRYSENEVELNYSTKESALLVVTDSYYPGWRALIDGERTEILRADFNLRAVVVPRGKHRVLFEFRPESFFIGLAVSALTLALLLFLLAMSFVKKLPLFKK